MKKKHFILQNLKYTVLAIHPVITCKSLILLVGTQCFEHSTPCTPCKRRQLKWPYFGTSNKLIIIFCWVKSIITVIPRKYYSISFLLGIIDTVHLRFLRQFVSDPHQDILWESHPPCQTVENLFPEQEPRQNLH